MLETFGTLQIRSIEMLTYGHTFIGYESSTFVEKILDKGVMLLEAHWELDKHIGNRWERKGAW
jgi:hypothetical protein